MTRASRSAIAAQRREVALRMRESGKTWAEIGSHLGVTAGRACQIANPTVRRRPGNPNRPEPVSGRTTLDEYIEARARAVDECAENTAKAAEVRRSIAIEMAAEEP